MLEMSKMHAEAPPPPLKNTRTMSPLLPPCPPIHTHKDTHTHTQLLLILTYHKFLRKKTTQKHTYPISITDVITSILTRGLPPHQTNTCISAKKLIICHRHQEPWGKRRTFHASLCASCMSCKQKYFFSNPGS